MSETSHRLTLPYLQSAQAQKHVTHNEALRLLDALVQTTVQGVNVQDPPATMTSGDIYAVGATPLGDWSGNPFTLAVRQQSGWDHIEARIGWRIWDLETDAAYVFDGSAWRVEGAALDQLDNLTGVGIGTSADATNKLAVASEATLLNHAGAGHQLKLNKASTPDTASLLFQTGFDGRAEMGLAGEDAFSLKVRAAAGPWREAIRIDPDAKRITFASGDSVQATMGAGGLTLDTPLTGTAVQSSKVDRTQDRLLKMGAFGLGSTVQGLGAGSDYNTSYPKGVSMFIGHPSSASAPANNPFGGNLGSVGLQIFAASSNRGTQILAQVQKDGALNGRIAIRSYDGTWADWREIYTNETVVGPVSQSSGIPNGAVIERGTNANGSFTRWADGTQMCWNDNAPITTEPASFVGTITKIDGDKLWLGRWF